MQKLQINQMGANITCKHVLPGGRNDPLSLRKGIMSVSGEVICSDTSSTRQYLLYIHHCGIYLAFTLMNHSSREYLSKPVMPGQEIIFLFIVKQKVTWANILESHHRISEAAVEIVYHTKCYLHMARCISSL